VVLDGTDSQCSEYRRGLRSDYCLNCGGTLFSHRAPMAIGAEKTIPVGSGEMVDLEELVKLKPWWKYR
jgi:hypothetical protein